MQSLTRSLSYVFYITLFLLIGCDSPEKNNTQAFVKDDTLCDFFKGSCNQHLEELDISLNITPKNTPSEKPLNLTITTSKSVKVLSARLEGRDMFMGVIPVKLDEVSETVHQGVLIYGSCSSGYMVWRLFLNIETENGATQTIFFDFLADN